MSTKIITLLGVACLSSCCLINPSMCDIECGNGRKVPRPKNPEKAYRLAYTEYEIGMGQVQGGLASILSGDFAPSLKTKVVSLQDDLKSEVIINKQNNLTELLKIQSDPCNMQQISANLEAHKTIRLQTLERYKTVVEEIKAAKELALAKQEQNSRIEELVESLSKEVEDSKKNISELRS